MNHVMDRLLKIATELDNSGEFELASNVDDIMLDLSKEAGILWTGGDASDDEESEEEESEEVDEDVEAALDILVDKLSEDELSELPAKAWMEALEILLDDSKE